MHIQYNVKSAHLMKTISTDPDCVVSNNSETENMIQVNLGALSWFYFFFLLRVFSSESLTMSVCCVALGRYYTEVFAEDSCGLWLEDENDDSGSKQCP